MRQFEGVLFEVYSLGLLHHAIAHGDQNARARVQRSLSEMVLRWVHEHPSREVACRSESEEHYVALAFERFWQVTLQRQVVCKTLTEVLICLRASLNGAILETLRLSSHPNAVREHASAEQDPRGKPQGLEVWNWVQATLSSEHERQLAYLLYHYGLSPEEIVRYYPQEWSDVHEVACLRRCILKQLTKGLI